MWSILQNNEEIHQKVTHKIQVGKLKWRKTSGEICDCKVTTKLKGKFYHTSMYLTILYGSEFSALKG